VPIVLKSGSLNLLEPSGPVQACNGIALPLLEFMSFLLVLWSQLFIMWRLNLECETVRPWSYLGIAGCI